MPEAELPRSFGPYLRYAIAANFSNFDPFDDGAFRLLLLVEFKNLEAPAKFVTRMRNHQPNAIAVELGPTHAHARHVPVRAEKAAVGSETIGIWNDLASSVELSLPLLPAKFLRGLTVNRPDKRYELDGEPDAEVLIGVIDDGCPFAAAQFLSSTGAAAKTRVRAIWDQNQPRDPVHITDQNGQQHTFGQVLNDFNYGLEFWRTTYTSTSGSSQL